MTNIENLAIYRNIKGLAPNLISVRALCSHDIDLIVAALCIASLSKRVLVANVSIS